MLTAINTYVTIQVEGFDSAFRDAGELIEQHITEADNGADPNFVLTREMENAGRLLTRDVLIDRIWGSDYFGDTKTLDVHIKRLRTHIEEDPSSPKLITTIRGVGYRFDAKRT